MLEGGDVDSNLPMKHGGTMPSSSPREGLRVMLLLHALISIETLSASAMRDRWWDAWKNLTPFFGRKQS